jgi:type I restriction enzyme S subunit
MNELPTGWARAALGDATTVRKEKEDPRNLPNLPFIGLEEVEAHTGRIISTQNTSTLKSAVALFAKGDILYGRLRPYLNKVVIPDFAGAASAEFVVLPGSKLLEPRYLQCVLMSPTFVEFTALKSTGDRPRVSYESISPYLFPLPPIKEQGRIVAKIDSLSAKSKRARDHLDHIPRLVEKYKQAILAAAFRGVLTLEWRATRPQCVPVAPRSEPSKRKSAAPREDFVAPFDVPDGWKWLRLPQIGGLDRGRSRHRPRNDPRLFGGPHPFIQTGEVRAANGLVTSFTETYSDFGLSQSRLWPKGTVCITIAANIAETAILGIEACFPDSVVGFTADDACTMPRYVEFFLRTARDELAAFAPATAQKNINLDVLSRIRLPVAPLDEQREIVARIEKAFSWIDRLGSEVVNARKLIDHLDQAVLAKAFRGELVPQDPNDEPASVLLERIRVERATAPVKVKARGSKHFVRQRQPKRSAKSIPS